MGGPKQRPMEERFWEKVARTDDGCWLWTAALDTPGYGMLRVGSRRDGTGRTARASRLSWEIHFGPIPPGKQVLHRCDNPPCVRPDHLFLGTPRTNAKDRVAKGRQYRGSNNRGIANRNAKLNPAAVRDIRRRYASTAASADELAAKYGVGRGAIWKVISGARWAHVQ